MDSTKIQAGLAIASFTTGAILAAVCLFFIPPYGEIATSAISIVSEFLVLAGALLGIKVNYDYKLQRFESELREKTTRREDRDE